MRRRTRIVLALVAGGATAAIAGGPSLAPGSRTAGRGSAAPPIAGKLLVFGRKPAAL